AGLAFAGLINIWIILASTLVMGIAFGFDLPARAALVPQIVQRRHLSMAIALNTTMFHVGMFIGPVLFAAINAMLDVAWAFALNAVSYFTYVFCLASMRMEETQRESTGLFSDMIEGVRFTLAHRGIMTLLLLGSAVHLLLRPYVDLLPGFSAQVFGQGAEGYATMLSTIGLGALLSGIWLSLRGRMSGLAGIMSFGIPGTATALFVFALTDIFWLGLVCMFLTGFFLMTQAVANQSLVQNAAGPAMRGRVISLSMAIALGLPALGALIQGTIADFTGVQAPVLVAGLLVMGVWLVLRARLQSHAQRLESIDNPEEG
ncbi:MAG: MFS transporter, partial [Rhodospirillales bacterium]|nr:MFS transporter [Rhodospirillales bacterium]